jgi:hypothetical protein
VSGAMMSIFGNLSAFEAKASLDAVDASGQLQSSTPMEVGFLDRKIRIEMDMTHMKGKAIPPEMVATLDKMGMARVLSIIRPDKKLLYIAYPGQKVLCTRSMSKDEAEAYSKPPKMAKTRLGKETINGHPCVRNKVVLTDANNKTLELTTWEASDLKDFPVQIQTQEEGKTVLWRFQQVEFTRPDATRFEPPNGYTRYPDMDSLMRAVLEKSGALGQGK